MRSNSRNTRHHVTASIPCFANSNAYASRDREAYKTGRLKNEDMANGHCLIPSSRALVAATFTTHVYLYIEDRPRRWAIFGFIVIIDSESYDVDGVGGWWWWGGVRHRGAIFELWRAAVARRARRTKPA